MKRLCIYLTYDKQKIIDAYIGYMLKQLKTCADYLVVVCNEPEIVRGVEILEEYADDIFFRENVGYDAGGFKDALCQFVGWDKVLSYEELVLVNDSIFGPFSSMIEIFDKMDQKSADFWALSKHGEYHEEGIEGFPEHLQSFFMTIRTGMLHSSSFRKYWEDLPYFHEFSDVVYKHETKFTLYFAEQGFSYACLADMEPNDSEVVKNNYIQYARLSYELIKKRNFPFLKKQPLAWNTLDYQTQENPRLALEYIDKHTDYDVNLIWNNIIRTLDISDLQRNLHLQYIIPSSTRESARNKKVTVAVFVDYNRSEEDVLEYLENVKNACEIKIFSQKPELLEIYKSKGYQYAYLNGVEGYGRILEELGKSEIVCILHDADVTGVCDPSCVGKSYFFHIWENLLKNDSHVSWVVERFEKEPLLGLLAPPEANFGKYFGNLGIRWGNNFEKIRAAAEKMQLHCQMAYKKPPFIHPQNFWIQGKILKDLSKKEICDFAALPYLWCYIVQNAGFYSGIVESEDYAAMNEINLQYYVSTLTEQLRRQCGSFNNFRGLQKNISERILYNFCHKIEHLYVYGTGRVAKYYQHMFSGIEAYIVSDGQSKEEEMNGIKVLYLSEVEVRDDAGILVCVGEKNQKQIVSLLEKKGWHNYVCI